MMRHLFLLLLMMSLSGASTGQQPEAANVDHIEFNGRRLVFAYEGGNVAETFREYIPEGESLKRWTHLASIRECSTCGDPLVFAQSLSRLIKQNYPSSQSAIIHNKENGIVIIDFTILPPDNAFVEFNIFKIQASGMNSLVYHQYAVREYENQKEFLDSLRELRRTLVTEMIDSGLRRSAASPSTAVRQIAPPR